MESSESISKTRLKIAGAFGNDIRELFSVEIKPGQIVGAYNYGGSPRHFTKHDDGMLHEKSDPENRLLWERVGQPLTALTGSESLGTYSFTVASRDDLPRFKPGQRVTSLLPAKSASLERISPRRESGFFLWRIEEGKLPAAPHAHAFPDFVFPIGTAHPHDRHTTTIGLWPARFHLQVSFAIRFLVSVLTSAHHPSNGDSVSATCAGVETRPSNGRVTRSGVATQRAVTREASLVAGLRTLSTAFLHLFVPFSID